MLLNNTFSIKHKLFYNSETKVERRLKRESFRMLILMKYLSVSEIGEMFPCLIPCFYLYN